MTQQQGMPTAAQKASAVKVASEVAKHMLSRAPFDNRGFSRRTIDALIARGIDAPGAKASAANFLELGFPEM